MSAFTPAQRQHAISLYKRILRTSRDVFANDAPTLSAWRLKVREEFKQARQQTDTAAIEQGLATWEDVNTVLRQNVVQGELNDQSSAFQLRFRPDTEMGTNDSIKAARQKQLDDLRASKGALQCGGGSSTEGIGASSSTTGQRISGSGLAKHPQQQVRHKSDKIHTKIYDQDWVKKMPSIRERTLPLTSNDADPLARNPFAGKLVQDPTWETGPLPRPVPHFAQVAVLADGSTIQLHTASPRGLLKLTRDPTNHPAWNPRVERGRGASDEDESGRLARFRKRFGGADVLQSEAEQAKEAESAAAGSVQRPASKRDQFSEEDFEWMGIGGRAASGRAVEMPTRKGKGKK